MKPSIAITAWSEIIANQSDETIIDFVAAPFHERIYQEQSFDLLDQLNPVQKSLVIHHYLMMHVPSGGFIQFIHNDYVSLIPEFMEGLKAVGDTKMLAILDAVLVAYVKHHAEFLRANTLELFTKLYDQLPEFSELDKRFLEAYPTMNTMLVNYLREQVQEVLNLTV
jgi:hypothetical protein